MTKHKYYNSRGDEISEQDALDHRGLLRDQITVRVRMRDGLSDAAARDARARAYELYDQEIQQAWRNTDPRGRSHEMKGRCPPLSRHEWRIFCIKVF